MASPSIEAERKFTCFPRLPKEIRLMIWKATLPGPRVVSIRQRPLKKTIGQWITETGRKWPVMKGDLRQTVHEDLLDRVIGVLDHLGIDEHTAEFDYNDWKVDVLLPNGGSGIIDHIEEERRHTLQVEVYKALRDSETYEQANLVGLFSENKSPLILLANKEARGVALESYSCAFRCDSSIAQTYFNFNLDTLYLRADIFSKYFRYRGVRGICENIAECFPIQDTENVGRVKKLAIFIDADISIDITGEIAKILRVFNNVQELSIVLKHYTDCSRGADNSEHVLVGAFDVFSTIRRHDNFAMGLLVDGVRKPGVMPRTQYLRGAEAPLRLAELARLQAEDSAKGVSNWEIPRIEGKCCIPLGLAARLESTMRNCEAKVEAYKKTICPMDPGA